MTSTIPCTDAQVLGALVRDALTTAEATYQREGEASFWIGFNRDGEGWTLEGSTDDLQWITENRQQALRLLALTDDQLEDYMLESIWVLDDSAANYQACTG